MIRPTQPWSSLSLVNLLQLKLRKSLSECLMLLRVLAPLQSQEPLLAWNIMIYFIKRHVKKFVVLTCICINSYVASFWGVWFCFIFCLFSRASDSVQFVMNTIFSGETEICRHFPLLMLCLQVLPKHKIKNKRISSPLSNCIFTPKCKRSLLILCYRNLRRTGMRGECGIFLKADVSASN